MAQKTASDRLQALKSTGNARLRARWVESLDATQVTDIVKLLKEDDLKGEE